MDWVGAAGLGTGLVGVAPTAAILADRARARRPLRRALGFRARAGIEMIVTTSSTGISGVGPPDESERVSRSLVPSGDLAGVAELSQALTRVYPSREICITPSAKAGPGNPRTEKLIVGGPAHNDYASHVICGRAVDATPDTEVVFDADERYIRFGSSTYGPNLNLGIVNNLPSTDYAVIILTQIRRFGEDQRIVALGGLTTYGTQAAAHFVAHDLAAYVRTAKLGKRPNIAILVHATFVNGSPLKVTPVDHIPVS